MLKVKAGITELSLFSPEALRKGKGWGDLGMTSPIENKTRNLVLLFKSTIS